MAEATDIAWADSTFNPWIGCMKVSAGCDLCYAEDLMDTRYGRVEWGQRKTENTKPTVGTRSRTSPAYWRQPYTWDKHFAAFQAKHGRRQKVFCASLADVFDNQVPCEWREDLWCTIEATPNLDWLLLTKRPENIPDLIVPSWGRGLPSNIWLGTTAEDQENYDRRWPLLRDAPPARVKFISYEPALGPVQISIDHKSVPNWIICGGESGKKHRDMPDAWAYSMQDQCESLDIPFFMKQMAGRKPIPDDLMLRQFPRVPA